MNKRELLKTLINSFGEDYLIAFLSSAIQSFRPVQVDYSRTLHQNEKAVSTLKKIGEAEFDDGSRLISILGNLAQPLTSRSGKKRQYEIARKILKEENYDAGFFIFHDGSGKFRFSLIASFYSGTRREFSNFRRYTYFISPELPNKTFINQVGKGEFTSLEKILAVFSLESVSNDFYNEFNPKFNNIANAIQNTNEKSLKEDFALLFVIRTIFLGFVQKKGWLGGKEKFLQEFWEEYSSTSYGKDKFYENWLEPLFFEALNSPPGRKVKYQNNDFSPETERILQDAPFLNGELFKHKNGVDNKGLRIPDKVIGEFLEFLFQYNFTIEENTLYDEELELNPEFLGIIFERLVNKADGAVYTPRTEVDFMCRMALVQWLIKNSSADMPDLYHLMFREGGTGSEHDDDQKSGDFSPNQIRELSGLLRSITICDPAAGSGAFEVGMLHVLEEVIYSLAHRKNTPDDVVKLNPFEQKKEIIANSLYGVEVKQWAVWINQLRLWLTLFVDMPDEYKDYSEPLLPSLNFKIRCGDSLVQRIGSKLFPVQGHANLPSTLKRKITELKRMKVDFFNNKGKNEDFIKQQENLIFREIIDAEIDEKRKELKILTAPRMKQENFTFARTEADNQLELKLQERKIEKLKTEIRGLEEQKASLKDDHPLIWSIEFAEIFYEKGGFDIIIGNPPYVRVEQINDPLNRMEPKLYRDNLREMVRADYPDNFNSGKQKISGKSDLYTFFYLRSLKLLNSNGVHVFICSNSWLDVGYGAWIQEFLILNVPMKYIIDNYSKRSFASSDINTIISIFEAPTNKLAYDTVVKFVAFKKSYEEAIITENLLEIEYADAKTTTNTFRLFLSSHQEMYDDGCEFKGDDVDLLNHNFYVGNKWGGIYLRAPDIYFQIIEKKEKKLKKLNELASIEGYIHDNNTGGGHPLAHFLKSIKDSKAIQLTKSTDGVVQYGVKSTGNSRLIAPILFPRTLGERHLVLWNPEGVLCKEFYKIIPFIDENIIMLAAQLNSTFCILQRELLGLTNLGDGALKFSAYDIAMIKVLEIPSGLVQEIFAKFAARKMNGLFEELGLPKTNKSYTNVDPLDINLNNIPNDRRELDNVIFDELQLNQYERLEIYRSVCQLVLNRILKAKSM